MMVDGTKVGDPTSFQILVDITHVDVIGYCSQVVCQQLRHL